MGCDPGRRTRHRSVRAGSARTAAGVLHVRL